ncbi:hypothetical protein X767_33510 [Mesorhizobium sp. LSJC264A00]|nr:hypothetical protein X767_33510 [Mesorhizobium sp. LSJC264A00]
MLDSIEAFLFYGGYHLSVSDEHRGAIVHKGVRTLESVFMDLVKSAADS